MDSCLEIAALPEEERVEALVQRYTALSGLSGDARRRCITAMFEEECVLPPEELVAYTIGRLHAWLVMAQTDPQFVTELAGGYQTSARSAGLISLRRTSAEQAVISHVLSPDERGALGGLIPALVNRAGP